jgi:hypothetical protein
MPKGDKVWIHYLKNIIASDSRSAVFLATYIKRNFESKDYTAFIELIDIQQYKVISQPQKVRKVIKERAKIPFVFIVGKN